MACDYCEVIKHIQYIYYTIYVDSDEWCCSERISREIHYRTLLQHLWCQVIYFTNSRENLSEGTIVVKYCEERWSILYSENNVALSKKMTILTNAYDKFKFDIMIVNKHYS